MRVIEIEAAILGLPKPADVVGDALLDHLSGITRRGRDREGNGGATRLAEKAAAGGVGRVQHGLDAERRSSASLRLIACTTPPRGRVECASMATRSGRLMRLALLRRTPSAAQRRSREGGARPSECSVTWLPGLTAPIDGGMQVARAKHRKHGLDVPGATDSRKP